MNLENHQVLTIWMRISREIIRYHLYFDAKKVVNGNKCLQFCDLFSIKNTLHYNEVKLICLRLVLAIGPNSYNGFLDRGMRCT